MSAGHRNRSCWTRAACRLLLAGWLAQACGSVAGAEEWAGEPSDPKAIAEHLAQSQRLQGELAPVLGFTPAIAASPFVGMSVLGCAALATGTEAAQASEDQLIGALRDHPLVQGARAYSSWPFVSVLIVLSILSILFRMGKLMKPIGVPLAMFEYVCCVSTFGPVALASLADVTQPAAAAPGVGLLSPPTGWFLPTVVVLSLALIMFVRLSIDILIWVSPVPFLDALFEIAKLAFSAGFLVLALISPTAAAVVAGLMTLVALFLARWAWRWQRFVLFFVLKPLWDNARGKGVRGLVDPKAARRAGRQPEELELAITGAVIRHPLTARRRLVTLTKAPGETAQICLHRKLRKDVWCEPATLGQDFVVTDGVLWETIEITGASGERPFCMAIPASRDDRLAELAALLGAGPVREGSGHRLLARLGGWIKGGGNARQAAGAT